MSKFFHNDSLFLYFLLKLAFFPIWWYSFGLILMVEFILKFLRHRENELSLTVWAVNLFTPMYGQTDLPSRLISLLVRSVQIAIRGSVMLVWLCLAVLMAVGWLALPIFLIKGLMINLNV